MLLKPGSSSLRLRTGGGSHLDEELVFSIDGGTQRRHKHRRWAGYYLTIHKVKLWPHYLPSTGPAEKER
jgi:hypothetical protein